VKQLRLWLGLDEPPREWIEEQPVVIGRGGEEIRSRIHATHQDRVLRLWHPTVISQWRPTPYRRLQAAPPRRRKRIGRGRGQEPD